MPQPRQHGGSAHVHKRPLSVQEQDIKNALMAPLPHTDSPKRCKNRPLSFHEHMFIYATAFAPKPDQPNTSNATPRPYSRPAAIAPHDPDQAKVKVLHDELHHQRDQELLKDELHKAKIKIDSNHSSKRSSHSSMSSHGISGNIPGSSHGISGNIPGSCHGIASTPGMVGSVVVGSSSHSMDAGPVGHGAGERSKDYHRLRAQCDQAMKDLQVLQQQHDDMSRKRDNALKEADMLRTKFKVNQDRCDQNMGEMTIIKSQFTEVMSEKQRLEKEVEELSRLRVEDKSEIAELRKQQDIMSESGSSEAINIFGSEYDSRKQDPDSRKNYSDNNADRLKEENAKLVKENTKLNTSLSGLKQHVTSTIQAYQKQLDAVKLDRDKFHDDLVQCRERLSRALCDKDKNGKEMGRLRSERQAVLHEYNLVMSERNQVYKEIDQLEEKLAECQRKLDKHQKDNKSMSEELETLRREIKSALQDRDHAMKELNDLREQHKNTIAEVKQETERRIERERSSRDGSDASSKDIVVAREIDSLRRELERLKAELVDSQHEVTLAKNRRDWVFSERDKIVRERESIRTLCDKLRRERDSVFSQFMGAVKDSDEMKQSKLEALRQLTELKEKYETLLEKESTVERNDSESYNRSTDSAIDSDMSEYHAETIYIDLGSREDLGFELGAGRDDNGVVIRNVTPGTAAFNKLRLNDTVLKVNNMDVTVRNSDAILDQARHSGVHVVAVTVRRKRLLGIHGVKGIVLNLTEDSDPGLKIEGGLYISKISPGSPAAREGTLAVGDRIVAINGSSVENLGPFDVMRKIKESRSLVSLSVMKFTISNTLSSSKSLKSSSSLSSAHLLYEGSPEAPSNMPSHFISAMSPQNIPKSPIVSQRSNGSQTDSLDSPPPISPRPHHTRKEEQKSSSSIIQRAFGVIRPIFQTDRSDRYNRAKSMYADDMLDSSDSAPGLVHEISPVASKYETMETDGGTLRAISNNKETSSGGTWPRRYPYPDYISPFTVPDVSVKRRQRPAISEQTYQPPESSSSSASHQVEPPPRVPKSPPDPPVRKDSFTHGLIVKHSPQNSDSTLKSFSMHSTSSSPAKNFQSQSPDLGHVPVHSERKKAPSEGISSHAHGYPVNSSAFERPYAQPPGASVDSIRDPPKLFSSTSMHNTQPTLHNSVVSVPMPKRPPFRPLAVRPVSSSHKKERLSQTRQSSGPYGSAQQAAKAESLDVGSVYSAPPRTMVRVPQQPVPQQPAHSYKGSHGGQTGSSGSMSRSLPSAPGSGTIPHAAVSPAREGYVPASIRQNKNTGPGVSPHAPPPTNMSSTTPHQPLTPHTFPITLPPPHQITTPPHHISTQSYPITTHQPITSHPLPLPHRNRHSMDSVDGTYRRHRNTTPSPSLSQHSNVTSDSDFTQRRIRIPSYLPPGSSTSSVSEGPSPSPMSPFHSDYTAHHGVVHRPRPVEMKMRDINIEKGSDPLGIHIEPGQGGGIFVSIVTENSLASKAGLFVGDQILEVCGINMRGASYEQVAAILRQVDRNVSLKVQYNPSKYQEDTVSSSESVEELPSALLIRSPSPEPIHVRSGSQRSSQRSQRSSSLNSPEQDSRNSSQRSSTINSPEEIAHPRNGSQPSTSHISQRSGSGRSNTYRGDKGDTDTSGPHAVILNTGSLRRQHSSRSKQDERNPERYVYFKKRNADEYIGFDIIGGNATGHFVHHVASSGLASGPNGLQPGDQLLELNGVNFRKLTSEQAANEVTKPCEKVTIRAQYCVNKYNKIMNQHHCDSLYVRCLWDYAAEKDGELSFKRNDILYIDNTMHNGLAGVWRAYLLDEHGTKIQCGSVPSKSKLEDECVLRRSTSDIGEDELKGSRRNSGSARRSFFRKMPKHQRNSSKDSRELNSFSDVSINSDSLPFLDDGTLLTYERMDRQDCAVCRPVLILGPLAEPLINKITSESPDKYQRCQSDKLMGDIHLDMGSDGAFIDFRTTNDGHFECIRTVTVQEIMAGNRHCMLNTHPDAIEKLHKVNIYPIVIFIKHESAKQIREVKDTRFLPDKMNSKVAKELFQQFNDYDKKYKRLFSESIVGGNLALMMFRIKQCIDKEQKKTLWMPSGSV